MPLWGISAEKLFLSGKQTAVHVELYSLWRGSFTPGALFPLALEFSQHFSFKTHPLEERENTSGIMDL